jgi:hypothetical protein
MQTPLEKAQQGLQLIRDAIIEHLSLSGEWLAHGDIQDALDIRVPYRGQTGWLSHSILDSLEQEGLIERDGHGRGTQSRFRIVKNSK